MFLNNSILSSYPKAPAFAARRRHSNVESSTAAPTQISENQGTESDRDSLLTCIPSPSSFSLASTLRDLPLLSLETLLNRRSEIETEIDKYKKENQKLQLKKMLQPTEAKNQIAANRLKITSLQNEKAQIEQDPRVKAEDERIAELRRLARIQREQRVSLYTPIRQSTFNE